MISCVVNDYTEEVNCKVYYATIIIDIGLYVGENGVSGPWGKWSKIKVFAQIQAHCHLLLKFFAIEI